MFTQLDGVTTKALEDHTVPIQNLQNRNTFDRDKFHNIWFSILGWYNFHGLTANSALKDKVAKLSQLLGFKPNYHRVHLYRNAVWGLDWNGHQMVLYYDKRGMKLQVMDNMPDDVAISVSEDLFKVLQVRDWRDVYKEMEETKNAAQSQGRNHS